MRTGLTLFIGSSLILAATPAWARGGPWTVSEASGRVMVTDASGARTATRGMTVPAGASVTTESGARAVLVRGQEFVTISPNSRLRLVAEAQSAGLIQVLQDWGNALFRIEKQRSPHFGVKTPYLAAVVKGTTFSITVSREGASMQVVEGAVEVSTEDGGARELIRSGAVAMVAASDRYRLTVGDRIVDSPARADSPAAPAAPVPSNDAAAASLIPNEAIAEINVSILAEAVDLAKETSGMIAGTSALVFAAAFVPSEVRAADVADAAPNAPAAAEAPPPPAPVAEAPPPSAPVAEAPQPAPAPGSPIPDAGAIDAAEEARKAAEEAKIAKDEADRKAVEDAKAREDADKKAADDAKAKDEVDRQAADEAKKAKEDADKNAENDAKKAKEEADKKAADDVKKAQDEADRKAADDAKKAAEDVKKAAEEADKKGGDDDDDKKGDEDDDDDDDDGKGKGGGKDSGKEDDD